MNVDALYQIAKGLHFCPNVSEITFLHDEMPLKTASLNLSNMYAKEAVTSTGK